MYVHIDMISYSGQRSLNDMNLFNYAYMDIWMYIHIYTYIHIHTYMFVYMYAYMRICVSVCLLTAGSWRAVQSVRRDLL